MAEELAWGGMERKNIIYFSIFYIKKVLDSDFFLLQKMSVSSKNSPNVHFTCSKMFENVRFFIGKTFG